MTTQEQIRKVTDIAQEKGWSISVEDENKTSIQFEFQRYTKYGQDFNFNADMQDEDINTLIAGMKRYYEDFDPDYEAYLWIGDDGHGRNGAPYHIKDIVSDMEEAEEQIYELLQALEVEFILSAVHPATVFQLLFLILLHFIQLFIDGLEIGIE